MATLTGSTIASSYEQLLSLPDGGGNTTTLVALTDGDGGTTFCLQLATTKAMIEGSGSKLFFSDEGGEYISGDGTDLTITSGADILLSPTTNVGIGNTVPGSMLEISKVSGPATLELSSWSATATAAHAGTLKFQKSGTATVNTFTSGDHTTSGEILGRIEAYGVDDADGATLSSYIEFANDAVSDADSSPGKIVFATSDADDAGTPTAALTIDDGQDVIVAAGNLTISAADKGISFAGGTDPDTAGTASANILDDYEEGTWVPAGNTNAAGTITFAGYTRIGRLVFVSCHVILGSETSGSDETIGGLPFTSAGSGHTAGQAVYASNNATASSDGTNPTFQLMAEVKASATRINLHFNVSGGQDELSRAQASEKTYKISVTYMCA